MRTRWERWKAERAERKAEQTYGRMTDDYCEVCLRTLRVHERVELVVDEEFAGGEFGGFTGTILCYCPAHAPEEARTP